MPVLIYFMGGWNKHRTSAYINLQNRGSAEKGGYMTQEESAFLSKLPREKLLEQLEKILDAMRKHHRVRVDLRRKETKIIEVLKRVDLYLAQIEAEYIAKRMPFEKEKKAAAEIASSCSKYAKERDGIIAELDLQKEKIRTLLAQKK